MARPLRFRRAPGRWSDESVRDRIERPLDENLGARGRSPWFAPPSGFDARRFEMDDGSMALFCWTDDDPDPPNGADSGPVGYWIGNTETPSSLWKTDKFGFEEVAYSVQRWAERELLAELSMEEPWIEAYPHLAWFFLPVFCSKDGAETTRRFFRDHAAGFPDADREEVLPFLESALQRGTLDPYREVMAGKLGTSPHLDHVRMSAAIAEYVAADILVRAGYAVTPEIEVTTGHSLDYRASAPDDPASFLVEVTRPQPVSGRSAGDPVSAVRDTAQTKTDGQLESHGGGVTLFVDCSSFPDDDWQAVLGERPDVRHRPAVVYRARPSGHVEGYRIGSVPLDLDETIDLRE
ncbi:DUF5784 family protein [Halopenitus sp. H-Gu1]|uniref:DUF5784 family protein n=1 Tax=Halopenitus sp. H-Gu1 TaxID=3242697 RepID=UPI00359E8149